MIGFKLKPYSLFHFITLDAMDSPLLKGFDPDITMSDLEIGSLICSLQFGDNVTDKIEQYNDDPKTKIYRDQLFTHLKDNPSYLATEYMKFKSYLHSCESPPTNSQFFDEPESEGNPSPIPWTLMVQATLQKEFGYSESESMSMPIAKAISLAYTNRYLETGECPVLSDMEILCLKMAKGEIKPENFMPDLTQSE